VTAVAPELPHDIDAERATLGAILVNPAHYGDVSTLLSPSQFFRQAHQDIFAAMRTVIELDAAGGPAYIAGLADGVPRSTNAVHYAQIVQDAALARDALRVLQKTSETLRANPAAIRNGVPAYHRQAWDSILERATGQRAAAPVAESLPAFFARMRDQQRPVDIIPELVPGIGITMLHGQPRSLKTWSCLEMALAMALGDCAFGLERFRVPAPLDIWYITEEDPDVDVYERLACLLAGRNCRDIPARFHISVQRSIAIDDPAWQARMVQYAQQHQIRHTTIEPIRASSAAVDQGPREIKPLAAFSRHYMRETVSALTIGHHDTKPLAGKADDRAKPQRASGGGIFSIADSPIHVEMVGPGSRSILTPSHYKFSTAPEPFVIALRADDPKRPTWVRIAGETTSAAAATELALHERITTYLREHPGTSGSSISRGIHVSKEATLNALDALRLAGIVDFYKRGQAQLWSVLSGGAE
jgi:hypothetical protein